MFNKFKYVYNDYCLFCKVNIICIHLKYAYEIFKPVNGFHSRVVIK